MKKMPEHKYFIYWHGPGWYAYDHTDTRDVLVFVGTLDMDRDTVQREVKRRNLGMYTRMDEKLAWRVDLNKKAED